jgi:protein involved in polysaccharide export with SLBB domain
MRSILHLFLLFGLAACAGPVHNPISVTESRATDLTTPQPDYRIQTGDQLDIKFFYNSELNESVAVRPDGRISLQLIGEIMVHGLTPSQLENMLQERYASQLATPEVSVIVRSFNMQKVFVDGHVAKPGALPLLGYMTVMQSISQAGGLRDGARNKEILVIRRNDQGEPVVIKLNLHKAMSGEDMSQDIYLAPFDVVFVPKSTIGNVNQFVDLYIRKNLPFGAGVGYSIPSY